MNVLKGFKCKNTSKWLSRNESTTLGNWKQTKQTYESCHPLSARTCMSNFQRVSRHSRNDTLRHNEVFRVCMVTLNRESAVRLFVGHFQHIMYRVYSLQTTYDLLNRPVLIMCSTLFIVRCVLISGTRRFESKTHC